MSQMFKNEDDFKKVTIETIGDGFLKEKFRSVLVDVLADIKDLEKNPTEQRAICIKIVIASDEDRERMNYNIDCFPVLAKYPKYKGKMYPSEEQGTLEAFEHVPQKMFDDDGKVVRIGGEKK